MYPNTKIDDYIKQTYIFLIHILNDQDYKNINNISEVSIIYIKQNIFTIKFTTYLNVYQNEDYRFQLYSDILKHIETNSLFDQGNKTYEFKPCILNNMIV